MMNYKFLNKRKKIIIASLVFILMFFATANGIMAAATDGGKKALDGLETTKSTAELPDTGGGDVSVIIGKIIGAGLAFIGVLFFILMIYGGFIWMMARGNEQEIEKAEDLIISAVVGLVIILAAYAITKYVGGILTS